MSLNDSLTPFLHAFIYILLIFFTTCDNLLQKCDVAADVQFSLRRCGNVRGVAKQHRRVAATTLRQLRVVAVVAEPSLGIFDGLHHYFSYRLII